MTPKIETFYTGGGITLVEANLNKKHYAVVSSDAPDFLTVYSYSNSETSYLPEDMVESTHKDDLTPELKPVYDKMLDSLKSA
mgnify:CR=1 FL=1